MEKLVQANSMPYVYGGFSNATLQGEDVISLDLVNNGVGPAHEQSLRVKVGGRYVTSLADLVSASVEPEQALEAKNVLHPIWNRVHTRFIPGGKTQFIFRITKTAENFGVWELLSKDQACWDVELCYCSVFQECWQVPSKWQEPERVRQCRRDESREFLP